MPEMRNVLVEAVRITRGNIISLDLVKTNIIDGLILLGGLGYLNNLSNFNSICFSGIKPKIHPEVKRILFKMLKNNKPIGAICIAPFTVVQAIPNKNSLVTIGNDMKLAKTIENIGVNHS